MRKLIQLFLGVILLWAAVSKIANPTSFLASIYAYELPLPRLALQFVAMVLPWIELICGLLLLVDRWTESALVCAFGMMAIFVLATGQAWIRGLNISCGCFDLQIFGLHQNSSVLARVLESVSFAFFRNLVLISLTLFVIAPELRRLGRENGSSAHETHETHERQI